MPRARRGLETLAASAAAPAQIHAAIYTRKSTTAGLDSGFTSLQNQRERGEAFIESQGWSLVSTRFDDGGFSGGNTDRPALQQLFRDVEAGHLDAIVVYRLDRISRSLADFVNIHSFLEKYDVALVSVTESINTQTPHGRMMTSSPKHDRRCRGWWTRCARCERGAHRPASIIQWRSVSREMTISWCSASFSHASVGPKSV